MWPFLPSREIRKMRILNRVGHFVTSNRIGVLIARWRSKGYWAGDFAVEVVLLFVHSVSGLSLCVLTSSTPLSQATLLQFAEKRTTKMLTQGFCARHTLGEVQRTWRGLWFYERNLLNANVRCSWPGRSVCTALLCHSAALFLLELHVQIRY